MKVNKGTLAVRLALLFIGIFGVITGFAFGFSNGRVNLIPIPGLVFANPASGFVIGAIGILLAVAEGGELYHEYEKSKPHL
jgi:hypothetical protein